MIRTRDLLLFLATGGFLVVAILVTLLVIHPGAKSAAFAVTNFDTTTASYTAQVVPAVDTKGDRLAALRQKLAQQTDITAAPEDTISAPEIPATQTAMATATAPVDEPTATVTSCPTIRNTATPWVGTTQLYAERENRRVFYSETVMPSFSTTTTPERTESAVAFTLPLRSVPLPKSTCIGSDVVAFTPTGSPIINSDYANYRDSAASVLLGYTLDGFELYGAKNAPETDACGGVFKDGVYRYYILPGRPGVLGCFAGIPVTL